MDNLRCPFAEHSIYVKTGGVITTCSNGKPILDKSKNIIFSRDTHTLDEIFNSLEFQSIRENLRNGVRDENCSACWVLEDIGAESPRLNELRHDGDRVLSGFQVLGVSLGNQCNLKCRTCNPTDSSSWIKEYYDLDTEQQSDFVDFKKVYFKQTTEQSNFFKSLINDTLPNLRELYFFGGEPFMTKEIWSILKHGVDQGVSSNIGVIMSTNCTIWDQRIDILDSYSYVHIGMSIDALDKKFEYLRYPAKWSEVKNNILKIVEWRNQKSDIRSVSLAVTLSTYNIWYLEELISFAESLDVVFYANPVHIPKNMDVANMPEDIKNTVINRLTSIKSIQFKEEIDKIIEYVEKSSREPEAWQNFYQDTDKRDRYRNQYFKDYFPEWSAVICQK